MPSRSGSTMSRTQWFGTLDPQIHTRSRSPFEAEKASTSDRPPHPPLTQTLATSTSNSQSPQPSLQYFGGKARLGRRIAEVLNALPGDTYVEPFVGAAWVTIHVTKPRRFAFDASYDLVQLWKAMQSGWLPPSEVSEVLYRECQVYPDEYSPELRAFIGFGCSFGGKWFGGYARGSVNRNYASNARSSLLRKINRLQDVTFEANDYRRLGPFANTIIYCDPPYLGTTQYGAIGVFDSVKFWDTVRSWSHDNQVVVSEYVAPNDFECIKEFPTKLDCRSKIGRERRIERLFRYRYSS